MQLHLQAGVPQSALQSCVEELGVTLEVIRVLVEL